jgi:hypothetical protein
MSVALDNVRNPVPDELIVGDPHGRDHTALR